MDEHELLLRHLSEWATARKVDVDLDLVGEALALRWWHDELEAGDWPAGTAERLLLVTWPAYGEPVDDPDELMASLATWWRFLRSTGRMRSASAPPAELRREGRRAARHMTQAFSDPARRSAGSVMLDFGHSIGISLDDAGDLEEMQGRLDRIQEAWNALPFEERQRRMPDPGPKSLVGERVNREVADLLGEDDEEELIRRKDAAVSAPQAQASGFVKGCLALADWVGDRREVTATGVLRPAVAREAYQDLDLWRWERAHSRSFSGRPRSEDPEVERLLAEAARYGWSTAADCEGLHRLWFSAVSAGLIDVTATLARATDERPRTDEDWVTLAAILTLANLIRMDEYEREPVIGVLLNLLGGGGEPVSVTEIREWWYSRIPARGARNDDFLRDIYDERLDTALAAVDDAGLWVRDDTTVRLTELGHDCTLAVIGALESGLLADHPE